MPICKHTFHLNCIIHWLNTNSSCPNCRNDIRIALREMQGPNIYQISMPDKYLNTLMEHFEPSLDSDEINFN